MQQLLAQGNLQARALASLIVPQMMSQQKCSRRTLSSNAAMQARHGPHACHLQNDVTIRPVVPALHSNLTAQAHNQAPQKQLWACKWTPCHMWLCARTACCHTCAAVRAWRARTEGQGRAQAGEQAQSPGPVLGGRTASLLASLRAPSRTKVTSLQLATRVSVQKSLWHGVCYRKQSGPSCCLAPQVSAGPLTYVANCTFFSRSVLDPTRTSVSALRQGACTSLTALRCFAVLCSAVLCFALRCIAVL